MLAQTLLIHTISTHISVVTIIFIFYLRMAASVIWWWELVATDAEVPGSIPGVTRFSEKWRVCNGIHPGS
jgi:hypothetical protein